MSRWVESDAANGQPVCGRLTGSADFAGAARLLPSFRIREDNELGRGLSRVHDTERHAVLRRERPRRCMARQDASDSAGGQKHPTQPAQLPIQREGLGLGATTTVNRCAPLFT